MRRQDMDNRQGIPTFRVSDGTLLRIITILGIMIIVVCGIRLLVGTWQRVGCGAGLPAATVLSVQNLGAKPSLGECFVIALQQPADSSTVRTDNPTPNSVEPAGPSAYVSPGDEDGCRAYASASGRLDRSAFDECMQYGAP
jgi:hypothetical protein